MTLVQQAAALFGIRLSTGQADQFDRYARELAQWNTRTNLTAITDPDGVRVRHFLDSLSVVQATVLKPGYAVIDVGTGAGFPGLPLAIAFPNVQITLLESTGKKIRFLDHMIASLNLSNVSSLHGRAEEAGHMPDQREHYDLVLARAVARLPALLEYLLPLARVEGRCIAMKGASAHEEAESAHKALSTLGGRLTAIERIELPDITDPHYLVVIQKTSPTPAHYPRKPGVPTRKPLL